MAIKITRREVLNNLIRFKENLSEQRERGRGHSETGRSGGRTYKVLLNRQTGDMRFAERIGNLESRIAPRENRKGSSDDWKEIRISVEEGRVGIHFEAADNRGQKIVSNDLEPLAWRIAQETLAVLNQKGEGVPHISGTMLPEEYALQDLSTIHLAQDQHSIENLPGWAGKIGRIEAETRLLKFPVGTYLLRDGDEITASIAFHLRQDNQTAIHTYILTVVEKDLKISDRMIVQTNKGWTFYKDNPNIKDGVYTFYTTPQELIVSYQHIAKVPVFYTEPDSRISF